MEYNCYQLKKACLNVCGMAGTYLLGLIFIFCNQKDVLRGLFKRAGVFLSKLIFDGPIVKIIWIAKM